MSLTPTEWALDPAGTLEWDSSTGVFGGSLGALVDKAAKEVAEWGGVPCGPQNQFTQPTSYPLRKPAALAALLVFLDYELPFDLQPYLRRGFPDNTDKLPPSQRRNVVY
ncbi:MAG: hypothetical protein ACRD19_03025 [Terriglobia bacterium]